VLLHVVLAAIYVNVSAEAQWLWKRLGELLYYVQDCSIGLVFADFGDAKFGKRERSIVVGRDELYPSGIEALASAGWIEGAAV
jgi:hypothetical protein